MGIFLPKHGLTLLQKAIFGTSKNFCYYSQKRVRFCLQKALSIISSLVLTKKS